MMNTIFFAYIGVLFAVQHSYASTVRRSSSIITESPSLIPVAAKTEFDQVALNETKAFLNGMFKAQIDYFGSVKAVLPAHTKRSQDIGKYIDRLNGAIAAESIDDKDKMWRDTFVEFSESAFLLNKESETGMSNADYQKILQDNGLDEVIKNFLSEVAKYFWKMAQASGKIIEVTVDEQLDKMKKDTPFLFFNKAS